MRPRAFGLLLVLLCVAGTGQAQDGPQFGVTFGVTRATVAAPDAPVAPSGQFAFVGGAVAQMPVAGPVSLRSELLLAQKGTTIETSGQNGIRYGVGYVELPLLVRVDAPALGPVQPYGAGGGYGAVKFFERLRPSGADFNVALDPDASFYERFDAGLVADLGARIRVGGQQVNLAVRRSWGLVDVARDLVDPPFQETAPFPAEARSRTWSLLLRFGL